jgi:hypothetical protein
MEMRIVVPDAASASSHAERLSLVRAERVSYLEDRQEAHIRVDHGSDLATGSVET